MKYTKQEKNQDTIKNKKKLPNFVKEILEWIFYGIICFFIALFVNSTIIINSSVPTGSMETTIPTKSRLFGNRLSYLFDDPKRGDIVIFWAPKEVEENTLYVKRIIGMPNDIVEIKDGKTYIDGNVLEEPYVKEMHDNFGPYKVPEGHYFVMGDNRDNSYDARFWPNNYISKDDIVAKAGLLYWPKIKILK